MPDLARLKTPDEIRQDIVDRMAALTQREAQARNQYYTEMQLIEQERDMLEQEWKRTYAEEGVSDWNDL